MENYSFHLWWGVWFLVLVAFAIVVGQVTRKDALGVLIDTRGRYSLTHFQLVLWTIVILSSLIGVLISLNFDTKNFQIPSELLGLMGISAGSGVLAIGVKAGKDAAGRAKVLRTTDARIAQIWEEEEGDQADAKVVSITKFQNLIFTLVIVVIYVTMAWKGGALPTLPEKIVWLIGISHAGYVGGKIPDKK